MALVLSRYEKENMPSSSELVEWIEDIESLMEVDSMMMDYDDDDNDELDDDYGCNHHLGYNNMNDYEEDDELVCIMEDEVFCKDFHAEETITVLRNGMERISIPTRAWNEKFECLCNEETITVEDHYNDDGGGDPNDTMIELLMPHVLMHPETMVRTLTLNEYEKKDLDSLISIAQALSQNTSVTSLEMERNVITTKVATAIANMLETNKHLEHVVFEYCIFEQLEAANIVAEGLKKASHKLKGFEFCYCNLGEHGAYMVADILRSTTHIKSFSLAEDIVSTPHGQDGVKNLAKGMRHNPNLTSFLLDGYSIGPDSIHELTSTLRKLEHLEQVELSRNNLDTACFKKIMRSLRFQGKLDRFYSWGNPILLKISRNELAKAKKFMRSPELTILESNFC